MNQGRTISIGIDQVFKVNSVSLSLFGLLLRGPINNLLDFLTILMFGQKYEFISTLCAITGILLFLIGFSEIIQFEYKFIFISLASCLLIWFLSAYIFPENRIYLMNESKQFFVYSLPFCWIGRYLIKEKKYIREIIKIGKVKLILALIVQVGIIAFPKADIFEKDYMAAANEMILGMLCVYYLSIRDQKADDIFLSLLSTIVLLLTGSRGAFVCICAFWIIHFAMGNIKRKAIIVFIIVFGILCVLLFGNSILKFIGELASSIGFSSHLVDSLINSNLFEDSIRTGLYENFWACVLKRPLFGWGLMGDRYLSIKMGFFHKAIYPHNIALELLVQFGVVFGGALFVWLVYSIIKVLRSREQEYKYFILIFICSSVVKLLFSSSLWQDQVFFLLIGILLSKKKTETMIYKDF